MNFLLCLSALSVFSNSFENETFKSSIKTVLLQNELSPQTLPIIKFNSEDVLTLRFDEISSEAGHYVYSFIKCNSNWEPETDVFYHDYVEGMENEIINDFQFSENTAVNFVHYSLSFPNDQIKFLMSGNYIVIVKEPDNNTVLLTRKFFIVDSKVEITPQPNTPVEFDYRYTHQLINFTVNHQFVPSDNPLNEFKAVVIQNGRYDNAKNSLKPLYVNHNNLIYSDEKQNMFEGGNEYRILDFRDVRQNGLGVEKMYYKDSIYHVIPQLDYKRAYLKYRNDFDHDGKFFVERKPRIGNPHLTSEYAYVHFRFARKIPLDSSTVYLLGDFNNGEINRNSKMTYKDSLQHYESHILLKQGVYDYAYTARKVGEKHLKWEDTDATHFQTGNTYTILIYFKGFNDIVETLIGVKRFTYR